MKILVVTNLYPPQELGGYGRSIADFVWGLQQRGHTLQVLTSDAPHLGTSDSSGPSGEAVDRRLTLKGTYEGGVKQLEDPSQRQAVDQANTALIRHWLKQKRWDGVLIGNLDLLGPELIPILLEAECIVQHHVGFVHAPFPLRVWPNHPRYQMVAASKAVRSALLGAGLPVSDANVVYPGARCELLGSDNTGMPAPITPDGSKQKPLKICYAGLLMASKGVHVIIAAMIELREQGITVQVNIAGDDFQDGYRKQLQDWIDNEKMDGNIQFVGQLNRRSLARFYSLHHVGIFPSLHPEAFGIVAAEMMASGLAVASSGVGGACELIRHGHNGLLFKSGDAKDLASYLKQLCTEKELFERIRNNGTNTIHKQFSIQRAAKQLEDGFRIKTNAKSTIF